MGAWYKLPGRGGHPPPPDPAQPGPAVARSVETSLSSASPNHRVFFLRLRDKSRGWSQGWWGARGGYLGPGIPMAPIPLPSDPILSQYQRICDSQCTFALALIWFG